MTQAETLYLKALSNYPFDFNEVCESLNYALSYDPAYAPALVMKGKIYMNEKMSLTTARTCFEQALSSDPLFTETYIHYGELLLLTEQFEQLETLIDKSFKIPGISKSSMYVLRARLYERQKNYRNAILTLNLAAEESYNEEMDKIIEVDRKRIDDKLARKNGKPRRKRVTKQESTNNELIEIK
jgi:tetratricopeptide (TPR) repeat protein